MFPVVFNLKSIKQKKKSFESFTSMEQIMITGNNDLPFLFSICELF